VLALHLSEDTYSEPRPGKRMAEHDLARQAEGKPKLTHFIFEQLAQGLQKLQMERLRQAAHVVVRLDGVRFLGLGGCRFDHVRIDGALGEPLRARSRMLQLGSLRLKDVHELATDDLALLLRVSHTGKLAQKYIARIDQVDLDAEMSRERFHHLARLAQTQESGVDKNTGELIANGAMDE